MRIRSIAASSAFLITTGILLPGTAHAAVSGTTLYVNNASSAGCSNSADLGTRAVPFCTIQAAVDAAQPGQTVLVEPGGNAYSGETDITKSGTLTAPITIAGDESNAEVVIAGSDLEDFFTGQTSGDAALVADSSYVTVDGLDIAIDGGVGGPIHVTGDSSNVTISRNVVDGSAGPGIVLDPGTSGGTDAGDVITTNQVFKSDGPGISVQSAQDVDVTSNTVDDTCQNGIVLTGTTGKASIENNIVENTLSSTTSTQCPAGTGTPAAVRLDAPAQEQAADVFNIVFPNDSAATAYLWGGTPYASAAALAAAMGQGAGDINAQALAAGGTGPGWLTPAEHSPAVDSADSGAPGELPTDLSGAAHVDDPLVTNTGIGSSTDYDRGAVELLDQVSLTSNLTATANGNPVSQAPAGVPITFQLAGKDPWGATITYHFDLGDGTMVSNTTGTATHAFSNPGTFQIEVTLSSSEGGGFGATMSFDAVATAAPVPALNITKTGPLSVSVNADGSTDPWYVDAYTVDFGDGYSKVDVDPTSSLAHTYAESGSYKITLTLQDLGETNASTSTVYQTTGAKLTQYGPTRILDTRYGTGLGGTGAKLTPNSTIALQVAGTGTIPNGVTAVALNLTAADTTGYGFVTAYADGTALPDVSNLNYSAGKTSPNAAIVPVGADGKIDLTNSGGLAGPIDLLADVTGYFSPTSAGGYTALAPDRLLDTRNGTGTGGTVAKAAPDTPLTLTVAGADSGSLPASGITAVALNVTATGTSGSGFVTVYPDGSPVPTASNLNYTVNQTVANTVIVPVGTDGKIDFFDGGATAGPADLVADVTGYYNAASPGAYFPVAPTRLLDTRSNAPLGPNGTTSVKPPHSVTAIPATASGYVLNLTVTQPSGTGFITAYPGGTPVPNTSNVNYTPGQTIANLAQATPGSDGTVDFANVGALAGTTQLIVDAFGYYASSGA